ncbi:MAG: TPM domain-containing protein [Bacteroidota bacterium]
MNTRILLIGFIFVLTTLTSYSQSGKKTDFKFPAYIGYVNDFERILTQKQIKELNDIISKHEKETINEIVIVTISSIEPYKTLFDYSIALANYWGIGKKDKNNGVAIVFGKQIRQIRIQVGYGLENKLKDEEAKKIIDNAIIPEIKKGDYYTGIKNGLLEIIDQIK